MPSLPARIDEVTFAVADLTGAVEFYSELFDAAPVSASDAIATFQLENCRLVLIDRKVLAEEMHVDDPAGTPAATTTVIVVARSDVDQLESVLRATGASVVASAEDKPSGPRIAFTEDRDGHIWEILGR